MQTQQSSSFFSSWKLKRIIKRQWKPITSVVVLVVSIGLIVSFLQKNSYYSAEGKLYFRRTATTPSLTGLGKEVGELTALREQSSPVDTEVEIIRSQPLINKTIASLNLRDSRENTLSLKDFMKHFKITSVKGTDVIQLIYEDKDPNTAAAVINTIMSIYLEENVKNYRFITSNARVFIEKQIPFAEEKAQKAELELRQFRELNRVISLEEEQKNSVQFLAGFENQLSTIQSQLSDTEAQLKVIQNRLGLDPAQSVAITTANQSKGVQDLLSQKQILESQLADESTRYQDSHPILQSLRSRISALDSLLRERIAAVTQRSSEETSSIPQIGILQQDLTSQSIQLSAKREGLVNQLESIRVSKEQYNQRTDTFPKLEQKQRQLARYLDVAQSTYTLLLKKEEELRIAEAQSTGNAQVISPALVPEEPVGSIRIPIIIGSFILGSFLGILLGYLLDSVDKSIHTIEDVKKIYNFPILGEVPNEILDEISIEDDHQVTTLESKILPSTTTDTLNISEKDQSFLIRDASQVLGLNLKVINIKKSIKVITVTSVEEQEGKSTIAAYLAASLAQLGERVVLVDANLHQPLQQYLWYFDNHLGLSDILLNSTELDLAMVESMTNLSLLPSGTASTLHPLAILDTSKMQSIIHDLSSKYDYVILDTPALRSSPDALFLSKFSDGMLLVVHLDVSTLDSAAYLKECLVQSGQTVFAQVVNGVKGNIKANSQDTIGNSPNLET